ncbi:MAG: TonB-dependent receptor, partial [Candidatus Korobacteraceae bacterium]
NALDARPYAFTSVVPEKAPFKWNQFGFTLGGPVQIPKLFNGRDRLFFMSNFEGFRLRNQDQTIYNLPSAAMRTGNFSQLLPGIVIRDPLNGQPFPGNIIPANRLDSIAKGLLEFYPEPNIPGAGLTQNYLALQNKTTDKNQFTQRIDFVESQKSFWFGRFSWTDELVVEPALRDNGNITETNVKQGMVSNTRTFSPSFVNEFRFGTTKFFNNLAQELQYERNVHKELGIGLFDPPPISWGLPSVGIAGFSGFGAGASVPFVGDNYIFQFINNVSIIRGSHSMKFGGEFRHDRYNMIGTQESRGTFTINQPRTGYGFADYMLGMVNQTRSAGDLARGNYRANSQAYFFQDTWRVRQNLTLDLGLRYEFTPPWFDARGELMNIWFPEGYGSNPSLQPCFVRIGSGDLYENVATRFDPNICVVRDGRLGDRLVASDKTNWAPRIGVAWSPTSKMTVRTGFGMFYVQDTTNPVFDMSRNIQGRIASVGENLTFRSPYSGGSSNPCGVQMPPQVCVSTPQGLSNQYDRRTPYIEQYLLNIQYQLTSGTAFEAGYFGNQGHRLQRFITLNQPRPAATGSIPSRSISPQLGNIQHVGSVAHSNYHSMSGKVTHRMSSGLTALFSYTWSKSIDNGSGLRTLGTDALKPQSGDCVTPACGERGLSVFDVRHRMVSSFLYDLPVGTGRRFMNQGGVLNAILGGWQLGGIVRANTGFPLTVLSGVDQSRTGHGYDRPNAVAGVNPELPEDQRSAARYFNIGAFQMNALGTYGNLSRATLTGPGVFGLDFSTLKNFNFGEGKYVQFRWEAFNALNHPVFADPNTSMAQSNWNVAGLNRIPTSGVFGSINDTRATIPMRKMQFALKIVF